MDLWIVLDQVLDLLPILCFLPILVAVSIRVAFAEFAKGILAVVIEIILSIMGNSKNGGPR
ncbi:MAG: hypothetical protein ACJZ59_08635 [Candidatus Thalassarchaeaceae archaeon]